MLFYYVSLNRIRFATGEYYCLKAASYILGHPALNLSKVKQVSKPDYRVYKKPFQDYLGCCLLIVLLQQTVSKTVNSN